MPVGDSHQVFCVQLGYSAAGCSANGQPWERYQTSHLTFLPESENSIFKSVEPKIKMLVKFFLWLSVLKGVSCDETENPLGCLYPTGHTHSSLTRWYFSGAFYQLSLGFLSLKSRCASYGCDSFTLGNRVSNLHLKRFPPARLHKK